MNQVLKSFSTTSALLLTNNLKNARNLSGVINKDLAKNVLITQNTDLLINDLKTARSVINVLELVNTHNKIMTSNHTIEALRTIFALQKYGNSGISAPNILKHPDFEKICKQLRHQAGTLDVTQTIEVLKVISFLGIPSNSTIYQVLLQLIRHNINNMSLRQIIFAEYILSKAATCPLIEALKIALPIVYDIHLPKRVDHISSDDLPNHLHYTSKSKVSEESVSSLINALMKVKVFDAKTSTSIIWSLCDMQPKPNFQPLLTKALRSLIMTVNSVSYDDLETTISKLVRRYTIKMPYYYNESLCDHCAKIVAQDDLGFETAVHLLRKFFKFNHFNTDLLNYISEKCHENKDLIENGDPILTYNVMRGCAFTDFKPTYYDSIKESFRNIKNFDNIPRDEVYLLTLQTALSVLDIYVPDILKRALNENYLKLLFKRNFMMDYENLLLVSQAIKTLRPEFSIYLPSEDFLANVKTKLRLFNDYPIQGVMNYLFGGNKFVKTPASTRMLHHIDHLVVLKKGGFPYPLNLADVYVEDIQCEQASQIVLIVLLKDFQYTHNNRQQLGSTNLMLQTLEAKGYSVVPVCLSLWKKMPEVEKIPYIMEAIKTKTGLYDQVYDVA